MVSYLEPHAILLVHPSEVHISLEIEPRRDMKDHFFRQSDKA
jgi:hypothetical protein